MASEILTNMPLEKAKTEYTELLTVKGFGPVSERISVLLACGRTSAEPVYAKTCSPQSPVCSVDGAALDAGRTFGADSSSPVILQPGQYVFAVTGMPVPAGCNAVVMDEDLAKNEDGSLSVFKASVPWQHIRQAGEDISAGEMILPAFMKVTPASVGAMLAGGVSEIRAVKKPVVGIIPAGDGFVPPCTDPIPDHVQENNSAVFSGMLQEWGAEPIIYPIVPEKTEAIQEALRKAAGECDIVVLNAGFSAGRGDISIAAIRALGGVFCRGVAIKPGKPAVLGYIGHKPVLGIPANPVSGIIVMEELVRPLVEICTQTATADEPCTEAVLTRPVTSGGEWKEFVRVRMGYVGEKLTASPLSRGSGTVSSFLKADGILEVPQNSAGFAAGERVPIRLMTDEKKLRNTLVVTGSHDPLLDELANLLHTQNHSFYMSSSHVGSMGGITAIRRGEAHAAGCHLLDTRDGSYNLSFLRKYFPGGGVHLIRCVGRQQGLMVQKGNPLGIESFEDINRNNADYVNRQKGSGTRILTDYLCGKYGIEQSSVCGYEREEMTHTSVAAQIAGGSADVGMGIFSAASLYGLDFVPVCIEEYDLIIPDYAWDNPMVIQLLEILKSGAFRKKVLEMGGYTVENTGEEIEYLK